MRLLFILNFSFASLFLAFAAPAQTPAPTYTQAQAQAGAALYTQNCAMCHGDATAGHTLVQPGTSPAIGGIFSIMTTSMPLNQPGSLTPQQYENIMAYALKNNGYPAGTKALEAKQTLTDSRPFVNKPQ